MSEIQAVTINVSNTDYTIRADIDKELLLYAVDMLNERIQNYKASTSGEELRAIVLAAVSIATEHAEAAKTHEKLTKELEEVQSWAQTLSNRLDKEIAQL